MPDYDPDLIGEGNEEDIDSQRSGPFRQLRDYAKKLEKELKAIQKEAEELRQFKAQREAEERKAAIAAALKEVGLPEKHVELFQAVRPDAEPTVDAVRKFAEEYGLVQPSEKTESGSSFSPAPPSGVPAGSKRYSSDEWWELYRSNPAEALKAAAEGRVEFQTKL